MRPSVYCLASRLILAFLLPKRIKYSYQLYYWESFDDIRYQTSEVSLKQQQASFHCGFPPSSELFHQHSIHNISVLVNEVIEDNVTMKTRRRKEKLIYIALTLCKHACKVDCDFKSGIDPLRFWLGREQKMPDIFARFEALKMAGCVRKRKKKWPQCVSNRCKDSF